MVDLPRYPRRFTTVETPRSPLSAAEIAAPSRLAAGANAAIAGAMEDFAVPLAQEAGQRAVTVDAEGNPQVERWPIVGKAGEVFNRTVQSEAESRGELSTRNTLLDMREQFRDDPDGFRKAAETFRNEKVRQLSSQAGIGVGRAVERSIDNYGQQIYRGLLNQKQARDVRRASDALDATIATTVDDMESLALRDGVNTQEYRDLAARLDARLAEKVGNPLFGFPQESADRFREAALTRVYQGVTLAGIEKDYETGGFEFARGRLREAVKELGGTVKDSASIERNGLKLLRSLDAGQRGAREAIRTEASTLLPQAATLPPEQLADLRDRAYAAGDYRTGARIETTLTALELVREWRGLPESEQARIVRGVLPDSPLVDRIIRAESGGDPTARAATSSAVGVGQFTRGTWLEVVRRHRPDLAGQSDAALLNLRLNPELSREMVARYAEDNAQRLQAAGIPATNGGVYLAHFLGPADAIRVLQAPPGTPVSSVVDRRSIEANAGIFARNPTAGQIADWAANKVGGTGRMTLSEATAVNILRKEQAATLDKRITDTETAVKKLETPDTSQVEALASMVGAIGTPEQKRRVAEIGALAEKGAAFASLPPAERAAVLARWNARMAAEGATTFERTAIRTLADMDRQITKAFDDDPYQAAPRYMAGMQPTPPPDPADAEQFSGVLAARVAQQPAIRAHAGLEPLSVIGKSEAQTVGNFLTQGPVEQAGAALGALSSLPNDIFEATVKSPAIKDAIAGAARSTDVGRYSMAMTFLDQLSARGELEAVSKLFGSETAHALQDWQAHHRYSTAEQLAEARKRSTEPGQIERRKKNEQAGATEARKYTPAEVVKEFDESLKITPGPVARALGSQPLPPVDGWTRDALMGDFEKVYARRYAETLDSDEALKQTIEQMKVQWRPSPVNHGRLMRNGPERYYPQVDGSWDWMTAQAEQDIAAKVGRPRFETVGVPDVAGVTGEPIRTGRANWDWQLISDRETQTQVQAGQPPTYQVAVKDGQSGRWSVLSDRLRFDPTAEQARSEGAFRSARQRARLLEDTLLGRGSEFPDLTPPGRTGGVF